MGEGDLPERLVAQPPNTDALRRGSSEGPQDNKNRIIGYNEFCLSCVGGRTSPNLDNFQKYCYLDMETLFRKFGIKLFVDYDDEKKEYKILEKKGYLKY